MLWGELVDAAGLDTQSKVEVIKNFAKHDLLPLAGKKKPGRGTSRLYRPEAVSIARTLILMNELGMRVEGKRRFVEFVANDADLLMALNDLLEAKRLADG